MKYLVVGSDGPSFTSSEEAAPVLEKLVLPTFKILKKLEADKKILAGGIPVGERAIVCIVDADSNEELDIILRDLPLWGFLKWKVTPLQTFTGRSARDELDMK